MQDEQDSPVRPPNSATADMLDSLEHSRKDLPEVMERRLNERFGVPLKGLKIYEDDGLADLGQLGYARGNEIHLAEGLYDPGTETGRELLFHEAGHVVQQGSGMAQGSGILENPALESQADAGFSAPDSFQMPASSAGPVQGILGWHPKRNHRDALDQLVEARKPVAQGGTGKWASLSLGKRALYTLANPLASIRARTKGGKRDAEERKTERTEAAKVRGLLANTSLDRTGYDINPNIATKVTPVPGAPAAATSAATSATTSPPTSATTTASPSAATPAAADESFADKASATATELSDLSSSTVSPTVDATDALGSFINAGALAREVRGKDMSMAKEKFYDESAGEYRRWGEQWEDDAGKTKAGKTGGVFGKVAAGGGVATGALGVAGGAAGIYSAIKEAGEASEQGDTGGAVSSRIDIARGGVDVASGANTMVSSIGTLANASSAFGAATGVAGGGLSFIGGGLQVAKGTYDVHRAKKIRAGMTAAKGKTTALEAKDAAERTANAATRKAAKDKADDDAIKAAVAAEYDAKVTQVLSADSSLTEEQKKVRKKELEDQLKDEKKKAQDAIRAKEDAAEADKIHGVTADRARMQRIYDMAEGTAKIQQKQGRYDQVSGALTATSGGLAIAGGATALAGPAAVAAPVLMGLAGATSVASAVTTGVGKSKVNKARKAQRKAALLDEGLKLDVEIQAYMSSNPGASRKHAKHMVMLQHGNLSGRTGTAYGNLAESSADFWLAQSKQTTTGAVGDPLTDDAKAAEAAIGDTGLSRVGGTPAIPATASGAAVPANPGEYSREGLVKKLGGGQQQEDLDKRRKDKHMFSRWLR